MNANKILIVDDIATNRKLLRQMLLKMGEYEIVEAANGKEAISVFDAENPGLILMDINMPEMDGMQSTAAIKKIAGERYIPIIFVTALTAESALSNALAAGGDDFISKPYDVEVLKSKINAHLRIRELNEQLTAKNTELSGVNQQLVHEQDLIEHFFKSALQQSYLDQKFINYHMSSMSAFNGDIFLVGRSPKGGLYVVMGDFTGHGLTAAMGTLPVAMIFFEMVSKSAAVADIARELNRQLFKLMPTSMFFAATILELNSQGNMLTVWMGGMPECYLLGNEGALKNEISSQHMPLGILDDLGFDSQVEIHNVEKNDQLYLYSDGIIEADKADGEMFGSERLKDVLISCKDNRIENVLSELNAFVGSSNRNDDITLVELSCHEVPAAEVQAEVVAADNTLLPWTMKFELSSDDMRNRKPVEETAEILGALPALRKHKEMIATLLSEIYFNALDYSILGLDNIEKDNAQQFEEYYKIRDEKLRVLEGASIKLDFACATSDEQQQLTIRITDNGKGYKGHDIDLSEDKLHGRGLDIIRSFCESVKFSNEGRTLELIYGL